MNNEELRERDAYMRSIVCVETELTDLPRDSEGFKAYTELKAAVADINERSAAQADGDNTKTSGTAQKNVTRREAKRLYKGIADTAKTIARKNPGYDEFFRSASNKTDEQLFAQFRAASDKAAEKQADFLRLGKRENFLVKFNHAVEAFSAALTTQSAGGSKRGAAVAGIDEAFDRAEDAFESLDRFIRNYYEDEPQKIAAWNIASHVERASKKKKKGEEEKKG